MKRARDFKEIKICVAPTDMRKQSYGLASLVESAIGENPSTGSLYIFCNRSRTIIKALYFDRAGFCVWSKKLDQNRFPWIKSVLKTREISAADLELLFDGVDVFKRHAKLEFDSVS